MVKWHDDMLALLVAVALLVAMVYAVAVGVRCSGPLGPGAGGQAEDGAGP